MRGTPQSLCDSSPINKGAKRGDEIAAKVAVDGRSAAPVDGRPRREAMGGRYPNNIRDNKQKKGGNTRLRSRGNKRIFARHVRRGLNRWRGGGLGSRDTDERHSLEASGDDAGNKKTRTRKAYPSFCV